MFPTQLCHVLVRKWVLKDPTEHNDKLASTETALKVSTACTSAPYFSRARRRRARTVKWYRSKCSHKALPQSAHPVQKFFDGTTSECLYYTEAPAKASDQIKLFHCLHCVRTRKTLEVSALAFLLWRSHFLESLIHKEAFESSTGEAIEFLHVCSPHLHSQTR